MNASTAKQVNTDDKGRYSLEANHKDIMVFGAQGMKKPTIESLEKTTPNVHIERE